MWNPCPAVRIRGSEGSTIRSEGVEVKENVLDVLMYLFETYVDTDEEPEPDHHELREELARAGFGDGEIDHALDWLDALGANHDVLSQEVDAGRSLRLYDRLERERLDVAGRGYILYLEQIGILSPSQRELVIDRLLALESDDIDVDQIKWVVLMVLFSQPGQEHAYARMEDLVFEDNPGVVH